MLQWLDNKATLHRYYATSFSVQLRSTYLLALNSLSTILNRKTHSEFFGEIACLFGFLPTVLFTYKKAMNILSHTW